MRKVWLVKSDKRSKAEELLKADDLVARQSIFVRAADSLGFKEEGFFLIIDGSEEALKKAEELLKDLAAPYEKDEEVLKKFKEQEEKTSESFGFIMGG